jgi:hypothetical protein
LEDNQSNIFSDIFKGRGLGNGFFFFITPIQLPPLQLLCLLPSSLFINSDRNLKSRIEIMPAIRSSKGKSLDDNDNNNNNKGKGKAAPYTRTKKNGVGLSY